MTEKDASPHYARQARQSIIKTPQVRVTAMTLAVGEATPWHKHSAVTDTAFRLDGAVEVQAQAPDEVVSLLPGVPCRMEPGRVHRVANAGDAPCRLLLVQGVGPYDFVKVHM